MTESVQFFSDRTFCPVSGLDANSAVFEFSSGTGKLVSVGVVLKAGDADSYRHAEEVLSRRFKALPRSKWPSRLVGDLAESKFGERSEYVVFEADGYLLFLHRDGKGWVEQPDKTWKWSISVDMHVPYRNRGYTDSVYWCKEDHE